MRQSICEWCGKETMCLEVQPLEDVASVLHVCEECLRENTIDAGFTRGPSWSSLPGAITGTVKHKTDGLEGER